MKVRILAAACLALLLVVSVGAQTKISGQATCSKPEIGPMVDVGDQPGHSMAIEKLTCTWAKPLEMEGLKAKDGTSVATGEMWASKMTSTGMHVGTMDNGDKYFVSLHDTTKMKDGKPAGMGMGTWSYTGGTGKLKGIKGKGTYKMTYNADGSASVDVEGDYIIPPPMPKKSK